MVLPVCSHMLWSARLCITKHQLNRNDLRFSRSPPCVGPRLGHVPSSRSHPCSTLIRRAVHPGAEFHATQRYPNRSADDEDDDGVAGLYDPAEDPEIEDVLQRWERGELSAPRSSEELPQDIRQVREMQQRKAAVIMDLIRAGSAIEERLKQHQAELDAQLLLVLEGRMKAARELKEPRQSQEVLQELHQLLCSEVQRAQASPAVRLLDSLLEALGEEVGTWEYEQRKEQCMARMQEAFTGQVGGIDIFRAAAALASREPVALEQFQVERVDIHSFMHECKELLMNVSKQQGEVWRQLDVAEKKLQTLAQENPQILDRPDMQQRVLVLDQVRSAWKRRKVVVTQLEDIWTLAQALESARAFAS